MASFTSVRCKVTLAFRCTGDRFGLAVSISRVPPRILRYSLLDAEARCRAEGTIARRGARMRRRNVAKTRTGGRAFVSARMLVYRAIVIYLSRPLFPVTLSR